MSTVMFPWNEGFRSFSHGSESAAISYPDAIQLCGALKDRERLAVWLKRLEDDRSTLYVYRAMLRLFVGGDVVL